MKSLILAIALSITTAASACDGFGFAAVQPQYGVAVQQFAVPVQQFAAVPSYGFQGFAVNQGYGFGNGFVGNRGFGNGFRGGFAGGNVQINNFNRRGFGFGVNRGFSTGFGSGNVQINNFNRRGFGFGRRGFGFGF